MGGHVFIVRGDITRLACDAWLMPCDKKVKPRRRWHPPCCDKLPEAPRFEKGQRVQKLPNWPENCPQPWLVDVGGTEHTPIKWYIDGVGMFLDAARAHLVNKEPLFGRARSLLALPVVGTGRGGALERAGEILEGILQELQNFTADNEIDVAVVALSPATYAAAQAERTKFEARSGVWLDVIDTLKEQANSLAGRCTQGQLAVFIGAGVSRATGLPDWDGLLRKLALRTNRRQNESSALFDLKSPLDQATIIERWLEGTESIGNAVAQELSGYHHYSLSHAFLASLPVREVITTNYDQLFEEAWKLHDPDGLSVLPGDIKSNTQRWLLKMHGCLSNPELIVLTRSNYTRYNESLPGLAGIVQAFLITRHMLFVGFSLTDDNFHRIIDSVRRIRANTTDGDRFGTVLSLRSGGLQEVLWEKDLHRVRMVQDDDGKNVSEPEAARRLEIFLDYLLSRTRDTSHLLVGKRFDNVLNASEIRIRDALDRFVEDLRLGGESIKKTVAWRHIAQMLSNLGFNLQDL